MFQSKVLFVFFLCVCVFVFVMFFLVVFFWVGSAGVNKCLATLLRVWYSCLLIFCTGPVSVTIPSLLSKTWVKDGEHVSLWLDLLAGQSWRDLSNCMPDISFGFNPFVSVSFSYLAPFPRSRGSLRRKGRKRTAAITKSHEIIVLLLLFFSQLWGNQLAMFAWL